MKKQKNLVVVFFLAAIICLASACVESKPEEGFIGGQEGLAISFLGVPSEVMEGAQLPISILLENKGEADTGSQRASGIRVNFIYKYETEDKNQLILGILNDWLSKYKLKIVSRVSGQTHIASPAADYNVYEASVVAEGGAGLTESNYDAVRAYLKSSLESSEKVTYMKGTMFGLKADIAITPILLDDPGRSSAKLCIAAPLLGSTGQRLGEIRNIELRGSKKVAGSPTPGEQDIISLLATAPQVQGDTSVTISTTARYAYRTTGQANVCISPNPIAQTLGQQVCQPNEVKPISSGSGPIQITELREIAAASEQKTHFIFQIKVKNVGGGLVYNSSTDFGGGCTVAGQEMLDHINRIDIESAGIGTTLPLLACREILLVDNEGMTTCEGDVENIQSAYEEQLVLTLRYIYTQLASQKLAIRNIN